MKHSILLVVALSCAAAVGAIDATGVAGPPATSSAEPERSIEIAAPAVVSADAVAGAGLGERIACVVCVGAFLALGGASIGGAVVVAMTHPEFVAGCGLTCALGFS